MARTSVKCRCVKMEWTQRWTQQSLLEFIKSKAQYWRLSGKVNVNENVLNWMSVQLFFFIIKMDFWWTGSKAWTSAYSFFWRHIVIFYVKSILFYFRIFVTKIKSFIQNRHFWCNWNKNMWQTSAFFPTVWFRNTTSANPLIYPLILVNSFCIYIIAQQVQLSAFTQTSSVPVKTMNRGRAESDGCIHVGVGRRLRVYRGPALWQIHPLWSNNP